MRANHVFILLFLLLILVWTALVYHEYRLNTSIRDYDNMAQDQLPHGGTDEKPVIHSPEPAE